MFEQIFESLAGESLTPNPLSVGEGPWSLTQQIFYSWSQVPVEQQ